MGQNRRKKYSSIKKRDFLKGCGCNKVRHPSKGAAKDTAARIIAESDRPDEDRNLVAYRCPDSRVWHVGHSDRRHADTGRIILRDPRDGKIIR